MDLRTLYQQDYPGNYVLPEIKRYNPKLSDGQLPRPAGKLQTNTTHKEMFKQWAPQPNVSFGELPSFTGSILYPENYHSLDTTTGNTFKGLVGSPARLCNSLSEPNIKMEGWYFFHCPSYRYAVYTYSNYSTSILATSMTI